MFGERKLLIALALAFFVLSAATAQTPPSPPPSPSPLPVSTTDVDPIDDLAGAVIWPPSGGTGTLYTTASDQSSVLSALGATGSGSTYTATINGSAVTFNVIIVVLPYIFLPPGDIVCANNLVRVYKNAQCYNIIPARAMGCTPLGTGGVTETWRSYNRCLRGTGYCIEVNQVYWIRTTWNENNCRTMSGITTGNAFICN
jgi:hypothetical protein